MCGGPALDGERYAVCTTVSTGRLDVRRCSGPRLAMESSAIGKRGRVVATCLGNKRALTRALVSESQ